MIFLKMQKFYFALFPFNVLNVMRFQRKTFDVMIFADICENFPNHDISVALCGREIEIERERVSA